MGLGLCWEVTGPVAAGPGQTLTAVSWPFLPTAHPHHEPGAESSQDRASGGFALEMHFLLASNLAWKVPPWHLGSQLTRHGFLECPLSAS